MSFLNNELYQTVEMYVEYFFPKAFVNWKMKIKIYLDNKVLLSLNVSVDY